MQPYLVKTPKLIQKIFHNYTWCIPTDKNLVMTSDREIFLTFDDGPHPVITPWVLKILESYGALATFFCVGENMVKYPEIFNKIILQKHSIGNHTFNHLNGWKTSNEDYLNSVLKVEDIIQNLSSSKTDSYFIPNNEGENLKLFRPPYGRIKSSQSRILIRNGYKIIMWDVLSGDFNQNINKEKCLNNVLKNTQTGSIVVFHDSQKSYKKMEFVLPKVLDFFTKKGFVFKGL